MKISAGTTILILSSFLIGACQDIHAIETASDAFLACGSSYAEKQKTHVMHEDWCYRMEISCEGLSIGEFGMRWQPQYGSWGVNYVFVGAEESGGCGAIVEWQVFTEKWMHKCEFAGGREGEARFKAVAMKHCENDKGDDD